MRSKEVLENEAKAKLPEVPINIHRSKANEETEKHMMESNRIMVEG